MATINSKIAKEAEKRALKGIGDTRPGMCQKFVRQTIQAVEGDAFDVMHKGTAAASMAAWAKSGLSLKPSHGSQIGDILYKRGTARNPAGHVGIRIPGNRVAENSTRRTGRTVGGHGIISLEEFGTVDLIVRLE